MVDDVFFDAIVFFCVYYLFHVVFVCVSTYYIFLKPEDGVVSKKSGLIL